MKKAATTLLVGQLALSGCAGYDSQRSRDIAAIDEGRTTSTTYAVYDAKSKAIVTKEMPTLFSEFILAKAAASQPTAGADERERYVQAGIALSNKACAEWFALHNRAQELVDQEQSLINLLGDAAIATLGLASSANANVMGYVGIALGGVNAGYETFKEGYFLSGTIWKLENGVREGRVQAAANMETNAARETYTYFKAQDDLLAYHNTCSRLQLIAYVEQSVELARYTPQDTGSLVVQGQAFSASRTLSRLLGHPTPTLSRTELEQLAVMFYAGETEAAKELLKRPHLKQKFDAATNLPDSDLQEFHANLGLVVDLLGLQAAIQAAKDSQSDVAVIDEEIQNVREQLGDLPDAPAASPDFAIRPLEAPEPTEPSSSDRTAIPGPAPEVAPDPAADARARLIERLQALESRRDALIGQSGTPSRLPVTLRAQPKR